MPMSSSGDGVLKMVFENKTSGTNVSLCAGTLDEFAQGKCPMRLSSSGGPSFQFLTIIDAKSCPGSRSMRSAGSGTAPSQFVLTIE